MENIPSNMSYVLRSAMANCSVEGRGSLFDWDVGADWDLGNETDSEDFDFSRLCERDTFKVTNLMFGLVTQ